MTATMWAWLRQDPARQVTVLELPYIDGSTSMLVILPFLKSNSNSSSILDRWLTPNGFRMDRRDAVWTMVRVQLPRFKIRHRTDLKAELPSLGVKDVFDPDRADLRGIADAPLYVGLALQEAVVEVTEEGTRAAAATAIVVRMKSALVRQPPYLFRADRPFAFIIYNRRLDVPLFIGKIGDPKE
jgi:serpin B